MNSNINLFNTINNGKQVGVRYSFLAGNEICWSSVGLQKWEGKYKVYVDEILESKMSSEEYLREEIVSFDSIESALEFIEDNTKVEISDLAACKGQRIFNPKFN
ncbi:hypothetical protein JHU04_003341 [Brenneria sp. 4F2]|nr:hypothetical protein [Brenneria bubanii]